MARADPSHSFHAGDELSSGDRRRCATFERSVPARPADFEVVSLTCCEWNGKPGASSPGKMITDRESLASVHALRETAPAATIAADSTAALPAAGG